MSKHQRKYDKTADEIAEVAGGLQNGENAMKETEVFAEEFTEGFDLEAMEEAEENEAEAEEAVEETAEEAEAVEEAAEEAEAVEEAAEEAEAVEETVEEAEAVEEAAEEAEAVEETVEEVAEEIEAVEEVAEEAEAVEEVAEEIEAVEEVAEEIEAVEEVAEEVEAVEETAEEADEAFVEGAEEAEEAESEEFVDFGAFLADLENDADEEADEAEEEFDGADEAEEADEIEEEFDEADEAEEADEIEEEFDGADEAEEADEVDEEAEEEVEDDDYLDYDEDEPREKKIVSGKTAVFTMLLTGLCTIALIVGGFILATTMKKDMGLSLVSYTDKFNACNTNDFTYAPMLGMGEVSYSDAEMMLTPADVKALSSGKTVTKFDGMVNLRAKVRFGKLVTMDIDLDPAIDSSEGGSGFYMMLVGNMLSGLYPDQIANSDECFMLAYTVISYATPAPSASENVYRYLFGNIAIYMDHSKVKESGNASDLSYHIESADPHYLDTSTIDVSWLPWNKVKEEQPEDDDVVYVSDADDTPEVSGSDAAE